MSGFGQPPGPPPGGPPGGGFGAPPGGQPPGGFGQPPGGGFGQPPGGFGAPPGGGFGQPPGGGFGAGPTPPKTDGLALTALITGGIGLFLTVPLGLCCGLFACLGGVLAIVAIPCGIMAIRRIGNEPDRYKGKGMAIGGMVCAGITLFVFVIGAILVAVGVVTAPQPGSQSWDPGNRYGNSLSTE